MTRLVMNLSRNEIAAMLPEAPEPTSIANPKIVEISGLTKRFRDSPEGLCELLREGRSR